MPDINKIIEKLMDFYGVSSNNALADKLNMRASSISSWKNKNSINAVKKKCRELNIYKDIFESEEILNKHNIKKAEVNRALGSVFKRRSLSYLYYLLKRHNIKNSTEFFSFHSEKDEENKFKAFISNIFMDLNATVSYSLYRAECMEYVDLYLSIDELDFMFENKEIFISSVYKIMEHKIEK